MTQRTKEDVLALLQDYKSLCEHALEVAKFDYPPSDLPRSADEATFDWSASEVVIRWEKTSYGRGSSTEYPPKRREAPVAHSRRHSRLGQNTGWGSNIKV